MPFRIITKPPEVTLICRPAIDWERIHAYLDRHGLEWSQDNNAITHLAPPEDPRLAIGPDGQPASFLAEFAGRTCYNSFGGKNGAGQGRPNCPSYLENILEHRHGSVLEHGKYVFVIRNISRGLTHELVRHRVGTSISQSSTRFRDESNGAFVVPPLLRGLFTRHQLVGAAASHALRACSMAYDTVVEISSNPLPGGDPQGLNPISRLKSSLRRRKAARGAARAFLPIGLESPMVWGANIRTIRNVLEQRASPHAEAEIREFAMALWEIMQREEPLLFADYTPRDHPDGTTSLKVAEGREKV